MTDNHDGDLVIRELANGEYVLMSTDDPEIPREKSID